MNTNAAKKRILILTTQMGAGHQRAAQALAEGFCVRLGNQADVIIVDLITDHTFWPLNKVGDTWRPMVDDAQWLWRRLWALGEHPPVVRAVELVSTELTYRPVSAYLRQQAPDLVITTYPLINSAALRIMRRVGLDVPFGIVVTDLITAPIAWFNPHADLCCVPTKAARTRAIKYGMPPEKVVVTGAPASLDFNLPPVDQAQRMAMRARLGLAPDLPTVLLVGGGDGMGPLETIAKTVADKLAHTLPAQLVVVCGRNTALQEKLISHTWTMPVSIQGFVQNMPDWMCASDCIVTKAGPGTISEAHILGLPIILSGFVPGEENGNVSYVVDNQVGIHEENPTEIANILSRWLKPNNPELAEMSARARALAHPDATLVIVDQLLQLVPQASARTHRLKRGSTLKLLDHNRLVVSHLFNSKGRGRPSSLLRLLSFQRHQRTQTGKKVPKDPK